MRLFLSLKQLTQRLATDNNESDAIEQSDRGYQNKSGLVAISSRIYIAA